MGLPICSVCQHPERESIDHALSTGSTLRSIAAQYGLSVSALSRHGHHDRDTKPALALAEVSTTSTRKFSALGAAGARIEELTDLLGKVGLVGIQRDNPRLVMQAARSELDVLVKLLDKLPATPDEIFTEAKDRTIAAVAKALTTAVTDRQLLDRLYSEIDAELIRSGVEAPAGTA